MNLWHFVLFIKIWLSHASFYTYRVTQLTLVCPVRIYVYYNITDAPIGLCALLCYNNPIRTCDRFIWDPNGKQCLLHTISTDLATVGMTTQNTWKIWSKFVEGCHGAGYDYDLDTNTCMKYHVSQNALTWKEARQRCQQDGGDLISIQTKEKWNFVRNYYVGCLASYWIGLKNSTWLTGDNFINIFNINVLLNNYDAGFPNEIEPDCGVLYLGSSFQDESCNTRTKDRFLCEIIIP